MSTATKEAPKLASDADLKTLLGQESVPLADVLSALGAGANDVLARAWAAGDIEFGRRNHCVSGPVGRDASILRIEEGWDWTGPKSKWHGNYKSVAATAPPKTSKALKYVRQYKTGTNPNTGLDVFEDVPADRPDVAEGRELRWSPRDISADEAHKTIALHVRLTDKGLGATV